MLQSSSKQKWISGFVVLLAVLPFVFSGVMKLKGAPEMQQGFEHLGWPASSANLLAALELGSAVLYVLPSSTVLGAILLTGYMGGAIATHLRIGESVGLHCLMGMMIWLGVFLREPRLRVLLPIRGRDSLFERDILIDRPVAEVFAFLKLLNNFRSWNPFLRADPNGRLTSRGTDGQVGFVAAWDGNNKMGAGEQEITRINENEKIEFELRFFRPFRATNCAYFAVEASGAKQTRVRWGIQCAPVFPMTIFSLIISMDKAMGPQFEWGLNQLKTILEKR